MNILKIYFETPVDPKLSHLLDDNRLIKATVDDCDLVIHHQVLWADRATKKMLKEDLTRKQLSSKESSRVYCK